MPREITKHSTILDAIRSVDSIRELADKHDGHFEYELELEVIAYGRNYNGKKVGPYVRLLVYEAEEEVIRQNDWGGNTFFIVVEGTLDVYVRDDQGKQNRVGELKKGTSFGEMSILAGVPRNATCVVPKGAQTTVLEVQRPALRLLRKLPKFGHALDETYRHHGLGRVLEDVRQATGETFSPEMLKQLGSAARFIVYGKSHVLFQENAPVDKLVLIKNGWVRRVRGEVFDEGIADVTGGADEEARIDFLGAGNCLGLEGVKEDKKWSYTATVMARTEALEVSIPQLRADPKLRDALLGSFADFSHVDDDVNLEHAPPKRVAAAMEKEISTGVVDGENLLVMDMDLCVRCGNCSFACHNMHGQSRLLRRGIHIERPVKTEGLSMLGINSTQHILSPSVCMHCQDPECLTGCPTGAIGRFGDGQIDIDPKTCIGCGDCATQCPYNAISMIPRKPPAAPPPLNFAGQLRGWLSLAPAPLPSPVTETDNLIAVKCNLCNNTPLNPPGRKQQAYSCQESCPTGALVRVNPREYFTEVGDTLGLVFRDETHAIGRNIHKRDPLARLWHAGGIIGTILFTLATLWALRRYGMDGRINDSWLSVRWITGLVGLLGIAAVMTYPGRKQIYRRRAGALRYWMLMHVYAGVVAGILLLLHGGRSTGGLLTSLLMISFDLVIVSGLFGIACYIIVPRIMTSIEGDPLLIEDLRARRAELRETLATIATRSTGEASELIRRKVPRQFLSLGYLLRQYMRREELSGMLAEARGQWHSRAEGLSDPHQSSLLMDAVESSATLRRVDALIYLHQLLKLWLAPHVVSTSIMLALMIVHIIQVVFFAPR
ncbi:MAG: cyclic nucleotide-binding domain-containing protein [Pyrinomonadaceae bacterium]